VKLKSLRSDAPRLLYIGVLIFFVAKMLVFIASEGAEPLGAADSTSEANSIIGARNFIAHGFWSS
jgi:hypothetical protein